MSNIVRGAIQILHGEVIVIVIEKDSKNQSETKRLVQEETVEQGNVSGFSTAWYFLILDIYFIATWQCWRSYYISKLSRCPVHSSVRLFFRSDLVTTMSHEQLEQFW